MVWFLKKIMFRSLGWTVCRKIQSSEYKMWIIIWKKEWTQGTCICKDSSKQSAYWSGKSIYSTKNLGTKHKLSRHFCLWRNNKIRYSILCFLVFLSKYWCICEFTCRWSKEDWALTCTWWSQGETSLVESKPSGTGILWCCGWWLWRRFSYCITFLPCCHRSTGIYLIPSLYFWLWISLCQTSFYWGGGWNEKLKTTMISFQFWPNIIMPWSLSRQIGEWVG